MVGHGSFHSLSLFPLKIEQHVCFKYTQPCMLFKNCSFVDKSFERLPKMKENKKALPFSVWSGIAQWQDENEERKNWIEKVVYALVKLYLGYSKRMHKHTNTWQRRTVTHTDFLLTISALRFFDSNFLPFRFSSSALPLSWSTNVTTSKKTHTSRPSFYGIVFVYFFISFFSFLLSFR